MVNEKDKAMNSSVNLNLARKWRSKNFDQIIGQELSVRMLKNTLYRDHYFPVYLFSGQRGCGKTTTARVFACAINCEKLPVFQKDPKNNIVPCLECISCKAMLAGNHPDFIEMDAASNTGVDNVRSIVDSSTLLPLIGRKKIYLIDEAHMLSKAAFNAFLKILEEPPASVLFILATTDTQKIIDTVKSRCFQLFFKPVDAQPLLYHLQNVCSTEKIGVDDDALNLMIKETDGSVRDALNLLEQVRFSSARITKDSVLSVLGHVDDGRLVHLFNLLLHHGPSEVLTFLQELNAQQCSADFIWSQLIELIRAAIWIKHGVQPQEFVEHAAEIKRLVQPCSWQRLSGIFDLLCGNETLFSRATSKHAVLEMMLLQLCQNNNDDSNNTSSGMSSAPTQPTDTLDNNYDENGDYQDDDCEDEEDDEEALTVQFQENNNGEQWKIFLAHVQTLQDPLIKTMLQQGKVLAFDASTGKLDVEFPKKLLFFSDSFQETSALWLMFLQKTFSPNVTFNPLFTAESKEVPVAVARPAQPLKKPVESQQGAQKKASQKSSYPRYQQQARPRMHKETEINVSDTATWKTTNMVLSYFPGRITEIKE